MAEVRSARKPLCVLLGLLLSGAAAGCKRGAKTPEEAYHRFVQAVQGKDAEQLYRSLDLETRWSWMTIRRAQREAYDILLSNLPEGQEREQATRRFEAGALSEDDAALFAESFPADGWADLAQRLPASGGAPALVEVGPDEREVAGGTSADRRLRFRRGSDGRWGFSGLAAEAEARKRRAAADLETIRNNAADQERAATRAGK
jgi:hypothetical protein